MEPRPPKGARPAQPRQPQQQRPPGWDQASQQNRPAAPQPDRAYGGAPYPNQGYPGYEPGGQGQGGYPPQDPAYGQRYPTPGYGQPGYNQPPPGQDPYQGGYPPAGYPQQPAGGGYPPYPPNDPYGAAYPPQQPGYGQPPQQPPTQPPGRGGGWIAPLPDEDLSTTGQPAFGAGYGKGGFSVDPRSGQPAGAPNRQTQIIAALAIGGLALMILAIVIGFIVFGDNDDDDGGNTANASATETALAIAAPGDEPTPTTEAEQAAQPTEATTEATTETVADAPAPTEPAAEPTPISEEALLYEGDLLELFPTEDELPAGFAATSDPVRLQRSEVAANLDSTNAATVEDQLRDWRFDRHWRQEYVIADASYDVDETSVLFVSMNSFRLESGASEALDLFVTAAESLGMTPADGVDLGDEAVMLTSDANGLSVVIYVRRGNVLMRMYGYSEQGDPTADVIAMTETVLAKFPS